MNHEQAWRPKIVMNLPLGRQTDRKMDTLGVYTNTLFFLNHLSTYPSIHPSIYIFHSFFDSYAAILHCLSSPLVLIHTLFFFSFSFPLIIIVYDTTSYCLVFQSILIVDPSAQLTEKVQQTFQTPYILPMKSFSISPCFFSTVDNQPTD